MKKISASALFLLLILTSLAYAQHEKVSEIITIDKVEEIISTLSSDAMRGRRTFTPGAARAGRFISNELDQIGLEYLDGLDSYRQVFTMYFLEPQNAAVTLNGNQISGENFFSTGLHASVKWPDLSSIESRVISESDNFQQTFSQINQSEKDLVVLVDGAHMNTFTRYANYFGRGARGFNINEGSTKLFVVADTGQLESGSFVLDQRVRERQAFNVAGQITGTENPDQYVLFSAHYDHIGELTPVKGDSIANGADDDASGTTAVIALAEYFKELGPQPRTMIFVAFTAEEMGGYGSQYFSRQMNPEQVVAMFNVEMIGKPSKFGPNSAFMTGFEMTDMGKILQESLEDTPYRIHPDPYPAQNLFYRSDNATLARQGVPAHTFSSVQIDTDSLYHTVSDELETLNLDHLTNMIRAIALSSRSIVSGKATPTRIDPRQLD